ncbi:unnamed protein product [Didymodactylos carnosus]|uniref:Probable small nuclear ribonucleoprotein E n=1 Tax=Didymodactylos carnosus TaxID=1234261 RepID=A0A814A9Y0_9BILA|nr:unnamed protein product [Didymodactylos carnosus]CAF0911273.1 unnamed protein product [Didymodactylos carnosus]CAF3611973.1 unnamed protein product [Didymodactylos carnosus]CAF3692326.1 unnamed protein product [Didymodactylos carnosus]
MGLGSSSIKIPGGGTEGFHVLRVQDGSPGHKAGLEAYFDFIVTINGLRLDQDNDTLKEVLKQNVAKPVELLVYSSKTQSVRQLALIPHEGWGGQGLLGLSIRFCTFDKANENVWHILDVQQHSPAALAGLRSFTDYIIGADTLLNDSEDLFTLIEANEGKQLKLYVYNSESDMTREITLTPNSGWGGEGLLGCGIGYGYLHRIPIRMSTTLPPPTTKSQMNGTSATDLSKQSQEHVPQTNITQASTAGGQPLLASVPQPGNMNPFGFTLQPIHLPGLPPITVSMPLFTPPTGSITSTANTDETFSSTKPATATSSQITTSVAPPITTANPTSDAAQFSKYFGDLTINSTTTATVPAATNSTSLPFLNQSSGNTQLPTIEQQQQANVVHTPLPSFNTPDQRQQQYFQPSTTTVTNTISGPPLFSAPLLGQQQQHQPPQYTQQQQYQLPQYAQQQQHQPVQYSQQQQHQLLQYPPQQQQSMIPPSFQLNTMYSSTNPQSYSSSFMAPSHSTVFPTSSIETSPFQQDTYGQSSSPLLFLFHSQKKKTIMAYRGPQTKVQKVMVQPINLIFRYLQNRSRIQVWLYEQTQARIEGYIIGFDEYMNLVLDDAEELSMKKGTRKKIGRILLKGDNISLIQQLQQPALNSGQATTSASTAAQSNNAAPTTA